VQFTGTESVPIHCSRHHCPNLEEYSRARACPSRYSAPSATNASVRCTRQGAPAHRPAVIDSVDREVLPWSAMYKEARCGRKRKSSRPCGDQFLHCGTTADAARNRYSLLFNSCAVWVKLAIRSAVPASDQRGALCGLGDQRTGICALQGMRPATMSRLSKKC